MKFANVSGRATLVIDGADAARFTTALAQSLAEVRCLLEAVP